MYELEVRDLLSFVQAHEKCIKESTLAQRLIFFFFIKLLFSRWYSNNFIFSAVSRSEYKKRKGPQKLLLMRGASKMPKLKSRMPLFKTI
jgi:hypothetical protein